MLVKIKARIRIFIFQARPCLQARFLGSATRYIKFPVSHFEYTRRLCLAGYGQTWSHPQNPKYIAYRNAVRGGPSCSHRSKRGKLSESSSMWFLPRDAMLARYGPVSLSVCVHYKSDFYRNGWLNRAVLAWELPPSTHTCATRVSPKIKALPSGTLSQTLDLENFATAGRIVLSTKLGDGRACWSHLRFFQKRKTWLSTFSLSCCTRFSNTVTGQAKATHVLKVTYQEAARIRRLDAYGTALRTASGFIFLN